MSARPGTQKSRQNPKSLQNSPCLVQRMSILCRYILIHIYIRYVKLDQMASKVLPAVRGEQSDGRSTITYKTSRFIFYYFFFRYLVEELCCLRVLPYLYQDRIYLPSTNNIRTLNAGGAEEVFLLL
jgi:hypothetical protein